MKLLFTGSTGFLGKYVFEKLIAKNEHSIVRLGRNKENDIIVSLDNFFELKNELKDSYDVVLHLAAIGHLNSINKKKAKDFSEINFLSAKNLCDVLEKCEILPKLLIFTSTVNVYGKSENCFNVSEDSDLNPQTPAALSKLNAENYLLEWGRKFGIKILILRLPLLVGANPPGNLGKMIHGIKHGTYFTIGTGTARKSMVLADDVASLIAKCPDVDGIYNLSDGFHPSLAELESLICSQLNKKKPLKMPLEIAKFIGYIGDFISILPLNTNAVKKLTQELTFSDLKARKDLSWNPSRVIDKLKI